MKVTNSRLAFSEVQNVDLGGNPRVGHPVIFLVSSLAGWPLA